MNLRVCLLLLASCLAGSAQAETFGLPKKGLSLRGGAAATRAAWGAKPKKEPVTVRTARRAATTKPLQKEKDAMSDFLSRDSRTTFIGEY